MRINKPWNGLRLLQALMPRARNNYGLPVKQLKFRDADGSGPLESSVAQGRAAPVRVLVVVADAEVRDMYLRTLRETDVSHDIAAFRELRTQLPPSAPLERRTSFEAVCCDRAEAAVGLVQEAAVRHQPFAIALIDVDASSCDGVRAAVRIRELDPDVEIVLRSGSSSIDPLEIGGLLPPEEKLSYLSVWSTAEQVRQMIIALSSKWLAERRIVRLAYFDSLTQLPNREQFRNRLSAALKAARQQHRPLAVLYLDLDKFKSVNDRLGHAAGDELLRTVARRLRNNLRYDYSRGFHGGASARPGDVARLSGDEFVALLPGLHATCDAGLVAERLIQAVREPVSLAGCSVSVTPSVGIAIYPRDGANAETLLRNADAAMYCAKRTSPGTYAFFDPVMNAASVIPFPTVQLARAASG
jgi:diguanylate cyclase (GGDEF)-like protein